MTLPLAPPARSRPTARRRPAILSGALWLAPLAFLAVFYFYPLGSLLSLGLSRSAEGPAAPFLEMLASPFLRGIVGFTFGQAALSTALTLLLGLPGAYLLARYSFRGKALLEQELLASGLSHAIVRPTVIYGRPENVLINNIAWLLRHLPVFGVFGRGEARLTPIHVEDLARICVEAADRDSDQTIDAVGPETFTYREMVEEMARAMGLRRPILPIPDFVALTVGKVLGLFLGDIVITRHEISGLRDESMYTGTEPLGTTKFSDWLKSDSDTLGRRYLNDLDRRR